MKRIEVVHQPSNVSIASRVYQLYYFFFSRLELLPLFTFEIRLFRCFPHHLFSSLIAQKINEAGHSCISTRSVSPCYSFNHYLFSLFSCLHLADIYVLTFSLKPSDVTWKVPGAGLSYTLTLKGLTPRAVSFHSSLSLYIRDEDNFQLVYEYPYHLRTKSFIFPLLSICHVLLITSISCFGRAWVSR